ncbi:MAG: hypothetical protein ACKO3K_15965 [Cuspidothrix sp.]
MAANITFAMFVAGLTTWFLVVAIIMRDITTAWVMPWAVAGAVAGTVALVVTIANYQLEQSFNRFYTFLILVTTSNIGLGLGWMIHQLFNPSS